MLFLFPLEFVPAVRTVRRGPGTELSVVLISPRWHREHHLKIWQVAALYVTTGSKIRSLTLVRKADLM